VVLLVWCGCCAVASRVTRVRRAGLRKAERHRSGSGASGLFATRHLDGVRGAEIDHGFGVGDDAHRVMVRVGGESKGQFRLRGRVAPDCGQIVQQFGCQPGTSLT
jgi:hypothetical protein